MSHALDGAARSGSQADTSAGGVGCPDLLDEVFQLLDEGVAFYDAECRFVTANRHYLDLVAAAGAELKPGRHRRDLLMELAGSGHYLLPDGVSPEDWTEGVLAAMTGYARDIELQRTDGRLLSVSSRRTTFGGYLVTVRDLTEKRRAEHAEHEAATLLRTIVEACPANFMVSRVEDGKIIYRSPFSRERFGDIETTLPFFLKPEDRTTYLQALLPTGILNDYPVQFRRQDGSIMHGLTSARVTEYKGERVIVSSTRDVTEQRAMQAELERQREIAHQNEKLSALGELLAGVAHELNNPLSIVVGYAMMLGERIEDPVLKRRAERIGQAAERCARIVKTFLAMARQRPMSVETCALNDLLQTALDVAGYGLRAGGAEIILDFDEKLPAVAADPDQMAQVFTNLIANAEHALAERGDAARLILCTRYDPATGEVVVEVTDNGPGISRELQARIFEPFFTTKDVGSGTGIGLAFCHRIVDSHGGRMSVRSTPGEGATFVIRLKADDGDAAPPVPARERQSATDSVQRVLVVDDEPGVVDLIRDLLEERGYAVESCSEARSALALIDERDFDAILSDMKMPGLDGAGFLEAIRRRSPGHADRIAYVTGNAMSPKVAAFLDEAGVPHLEKPVAPGELIALVERLCARSPEAGR